MKNINKASEEFVMKRCEEILERDEEYQRLNLAILDAEKKVRAKFTDDINDFLKYESLILEQLAISNIAIYKALI